MKEIDLPPIAPTLMECNRSIGYSLEAAVADIIDNSIFAKATKISISYCPIDNPYVYILDNGIGMDYTEINQAMQFGSRNPKEARAITDLGRFGLGLKTASFSQCRSLTLISKKNNHIEARCWDMDYVFVTNKWSLKVLTEDEIANLPGYSELISQPSGTLVIWQNLDRLIKDCSNIVNHLSTVMNTVHNHLALVFHRYLEGEDDIPKISIEINNNNVEPIDPFLKGKSQVPMAEEYFPFNNNYIIVQGYILPHPSRLNAQDKASLDKCDLRNKSGLYIYRNKRLLIWGRWFRLNQHDLLSNLTRIRVDIPNDCDEEWYIDIKKSMAIPPESLKVRLKALVNNLAEKSKRTYNQRAKRVLNQDNNCLWEVLKTADNSHYYKINKNNPIIENFLNYNPNLKKPLYSLLEHIEKTFPTDRLRVDIVNNNHISNDNIDNDNDIYNMLIDHLSICTNLIEKRAYLDVLSEMDMFKYHPAILEKINKELLADEQ